MIWQWLNLYFNSTYCYTLDFSSKSVAKKCLENIPHISVVSYQGFKELQYVDLVLLDLQRITTCKDSIQMIAICWFTPWFTKNYNLKSSKIFCQSFKDVLRTVAVLCWFVVDLLAHFFLCFIHLDKRQCHKHCLNYTYSYFF